MSVLDKTIDELADVVPEAIKRLKAFLIYEGDNPRYYQKAKVASVIVGSYVKAEATKTNRMSVEAAFGRSAKLQLQK